MNAVCNLIWIITRQKCVMCPKVAAKIFLLLHLLFGWFMVWFGKFSVWVPVCVCAENIHNENCCRQNPLLPFQNWVSSAALPFSFCWSACHKALWLILGFSLLLLLLLLALLCVDYLYFLLRSVIFAGCEWWRKRHCSSISSIFCFCFCCCWIIIIIIIITAIHKSKSARCLLQRAFILSAFLPFSLSLPLSFLQSHHCNQQNFPFWALFFYDRKLVESS